MQQLTFITASASILGLALSFNLESCQSNRANRSDSDVKFAQGGPGFLHGHEALIYVGTQLALKDPDVGADFYDTKGMDLAASVSKNALIWGSLAADFPIKNNEVESLSDPVQSKYCRFFGFNANDAGQLKICKKMPYEGAFQDAHFLRNWSGSGDQIKLDSTKAACESAQNRILEATVEGLTNRIISFEGNKFFWRDFWAGVAVHTVQDSFSEGHTRRIGDDWRTIKDICHYNKDVKDSSVCAHRIPFDDRDIVWKDIPPLLDRDSYGFMSKAGKLATQATKAYLITYARLNIDADRAREFRRAQLMQMATPLMTSFFTDDTGEGFGYLNCENL